VTSVNLVSIGRFARLTGLTVRAVRHYGELGLLEPAYVAEDTGYRYYALGQLADAEAIKRLRSLELGLEDIRAILAADDPEFTRECLILHRRRMERLAASTSRIVVRLDRLIDGKETLVPTPTETLHEPEVKEYPHQPVLSIRERAPLDELKVRIPAAYAEIGVYLQELGEQIVAPPMLVCPFADEEGLVPIESAGPTARPLPGRGRIESRILPGCTGVSLIHKGPYEELCRSYQVLEERFREHELELVGDPREIYLTDPQEVPDPADYVTEIVWPISPADAERAQGLSAPSTAALPR
jgi:effector-binding domain-containing protein